MIIGSHIIRKKSISSSMDYIKDNFNEIDDGTVLICDYIESARGRQGRVWNVSQGQLLITIALKYSMNSEEECRYASMALSCGILEGLQQFSVSFKWPNDVILEGKKVAGILIEPLWQERKCLGMVVGIGININNVFLIDDPLFSKAISISMVTKTAVDQELIVNSILNALNRWYAFFKNNTFDFIYTTWASSQTYTKIKIKEHDISTQEYEGTPIYFLKNGDMVIKTNDGNIKRIPFYITSSTSVIY